MSLVQSTPRSLFVFSYQFFFSIILEIKLDASWGRQLFSRSSAITLLLNIRIDPGLGWVYYLRFIFGWRVSSIVYDNSFFPFFLSG